MSNQWLLYFNYHCASSKPGRPAFEERGQTPNLKTQNNFFINFLLPNNKIIMCLYVYFSSKFWRLKLKFPTWKYEIVMFLLDNWNEKGAPKSLFARVKILYWAALATYLKMCNLVFYEKLWPLIVNSLFSSF